MNNTQEEPQVQNTERKKGKTIYLVFALGYLLLGALDLLSALEILWPEADKTTFECILRGIMAAFLLGGVPAMLACYFRSRKKA